jgi:ribosome-binding protein aMBF1 (putative translation factor)
MVLSVAQCRAARAMLDWSIADLAGSAAVGVMTVHRFEAGEAIRPASLQKLHVAFLAAGITFIEAGSASQDGGEGLRLDPILPA